jgi:hypothetical protein
MKPKNLIDVPVRLTRRNKYNAKKTQVDGITFDSVKEAEYYRRLKIRREIGEVIMFLRQVPFDLPGNVKYRCDFQEFWSDGTVHHIDVKGRRTKSYIRAKKQVEALYPITIEEV